MYQNLYDLINHYIFNDLASSVANQDLICTLIASFGVIFMVAIPFIVLWKIIKLICGD